MSGFWTRWRVVRLLVSILLAVGALYTFLTEAYVTAVVALIAWRVVLDWEKDSQRKEGWR